MISSINSKDNARVKYAVSLKENKNRKEFHQFLGESLKSLKMAIQANLVKEVFTYEYLDIDESIKQYLVSEEVMKKLSSTNNPEGVVFIADIKEHSKLESYKKILYLDEINDPGNMGTIIRTALAFNYDAVVCSNNCCSLYNEKVLAACKGSNYLLPIYTDELSNYKDYQIIVSCLDKDSIDLEDLKIKDKFVLVIGNEAHGVKSSSKALATDKVKISIQNIDSLNASVAAAILMYRIK